ncbi:DUF4097 family beta strand repeat-containing protein [Bacillus solimangrovi]|uniref:DUF4097 domain-containing protein n=1 Tax=Bacillus solimangrovi TaxID=1305675 RepID=A0A1E5LJB0_9BACI|nr:DUF4097 family beta strand repeat-containing protein [Bacillus solimangrovi]OEH94177.1 hypothetical protein BFG57_08995 [Bacillus solimangrovi]
MNKVLLGVLIVFFVGVFLFLVPTQPTEQIPVNTVDIEDSIGNNNEIKESEMNMPSDKLFSNLVDLYERQVVNNTDIKNININFSSGDVHVVPSEDDTFVIEVNGKVNKSIQDNFKLDIVDNGDMLQVQFKKINTPFHTGISMMDTTITVALPEKTYDVINIETSSGDIVANGIKVSEIDISASSGNVETKGIVTDLLNVSASSGHIKSSDQTVKDSYYEASSGHIDLSNITGNITGFTRSGDITIRNDEAIGNISAQASSGDVMIEYTKTPSSLSIHFNSGSGRGIVELDGVDYVENSKDKIIGTIGSGEYELNVVVSSGNFSLR